jgi:hypothetical protein
MQLKRDKQPLARAPALADKETGNPAGGQSSLPVKWANGLNRVDCARYQKAQTMNDQPPLYIKIVVRSAGRIC